MSLLSSFFSFTTQPPPTSTLFPYTTLFRSQNRSGHSILGVNGSTSRKTPSRFGFETNLQAEDRKSTRLNSSHVSISYAVFCLKKKTTMESLCLKYRQRCSFELITI